ncbi:uncharacterized protein LOC114522704 [Dendronephthya gigantea]|uniref:uncharacterized protein LOC114522704 n=1 Tax=Dendronephthya gigantea TaxID=151771 RepID=UPI00106AA80A|nr:uncharacterized protein LOC114522704 [Dendronephthya gigantea]
MRLSLNKSGNAPKNPSSQNKTKSNNSGSSSKIFSNFFIKPKDKKSECGDKSKERDTTRKHGFTVPFSKPVKPLRGNEIPFGKATIFRQIDKEIKIPTETKNMIIDHGKHNLGIWSQISGLFHTIGK